MGFMDGIRDVLGGFNAVKQIDSDGFDWREKRAAQQAARDQELQQYQQANQDYEVKALAEAQLGGMGDEDAQTAGTEQGPTAMPDLGAMRRRATYDEMIGARARGQSAQSKSALKYQDRLNKEFELNQRHENRTDEIKLTGAEEQEELRLREKIRAGQQLSPREQAQLEAADRRVQAAQQGANYRAANYGAGSRRKVLKIPGTRGGVAGTVMRDQDTYEELGFEPSAPTAATRGKEEAKGAAMKAYEAIRGLRAQMPTPEDWMEAGVTGVGRQIGAMTQANPVANRYKASIRGFVPLMARALGHVGVLTELDVERTEDLFSGLGATAETDRISDDMLRKIMSGEVPFQFGQGGGKPIAYVDESGNIEEYGGQRPEGRRRTGTPPPTGGGDDRTIVMFGGKKYRKKAGVTTNRRADYEEIP